jgi:CRISPR-associated endonuclease/helicase Cas3
MPAPHASIPRDVWAKSPRPGHSSGESLASHSASVARVLSLLARRAPHLVEVAADQRLWHRAFWACWLHDLGKSAAGFQNQLRNPAEFWGHRHEVLSLAFLPWVAPDNSHDFPWIAAGIASHHKDAPDLFDRHRLEGPVADMQLESIVSQLDDAAILGCAGWLANVADTWLQGTNLARLGVERPIEGLADVDVRQFRRDAPMAIVSALTAYRDLWERHRRSSADGYDRRQGLLIRGLVLLSDHLASAHAPELEALAIDEPEAVLARIGYGQHGLRSHQSAAMQQSGSLVLAAPTGSGKTEAAVFWAARQLSDDKPARKLIYLLPYQASLNAIHVRLARLLATNVGLMHSRAAQVLYRELAERDYSGANAERAARRATNLARLHQPSVWVSTPYQLLSAAYRLRQYEQTWASLAQALVVVDEPHAYDTNRLGLIVGLLGELVRNWGVRVCAMTATMPSWLAHLLQTALLADRLPVDRELFAAYRRHRLELLDGEGTDTTNIERIVGMVSSGKSVLVCVNTVGRAQQMRQLLLDRLSSEVVSLLHSRFTARDRLRKEELIQQRLQAGIQRSDTEGLVVVATQVIEVSLDLDFDTLFSDPAPLEALAQRFGRVNRRGSKGIVPVHVFTAPTHGQGVYDDELMGQTLLHLRTLAGTELDEARLGDLLDAVYGVDLAARFRAEVEQSRQQFEQNCLRTLYAFESDEQLDREFDKLFDGTEVLPASLESEYRQLAEGSILEAQSLLVPLADRQRYRLGPRAEWRRDLRLWVVDVAYDSELGLTLSR